MLTTGFRLTSMNNHNRDLWLTLSGGLTGTTLDQRWQNGAASGSANMLRWSAELALLPGWWRGRGRIFIGPTATVDVVSLAANSNGRNQRETYVDGAVGVKAGGQYFWAGNVFACADLAGDVAVRRRPVVTQSGSDIYPSPQVYLTLSLGIGVWF
jgi:hypothetical protein